MASAQHSQEAKNLEYIFHPSSVAIVGASPDPSNLANLVFLFCLQRFQFPGQIYLVGSRGEEISGLKVYRQIRDIPGPVDHVMVSIPAHLIPQLMEDCVSKGVKSAFIFSSGFSESGEEEGIRLEREIVRIAKKGGLRIVGPNCMGIYHPSASLSFGYDFPRESGPVGYLSQSGGNTFHLVRSAAARGLRFSKVISYGNAADLNEADFLEYFASDPETKIIAAYIEGVKEGQRFVRVLKEAAKAKPVIMLKGGGTEVGNRAVASHTGALAGSDAVWDALFKQAGVVRVYDLDEMVDVILTFLLMSPPKGRRVGMVGTGGGASVQGADECGRAGMLIPPLSQEIVKRLGQIFSAPGIGLGNPVDSNVLDVSPHQFGDILSTVASSPDIDLLIAHVGVELSPFRYHRAEVLAQKVETIIKAGKAFPKPLAIVLHTASSGQSMQTVAEVQQKYFASGFPIYNSIARAANAISKFLQYHESHQA